MKGGTHSFSSEIGRIAVLLGGRSREREISLRSGRAIYEALKGAGFRVLKIDTANGFDQKLKANKIDFAFPALHGTGGEDGTVQKLLLQQRIPYVGSGPKGCALAFNKVKAKRMFQKAHIPTPPFALVSRKNWARILKRWSLPFVIKPICEGSSIDVVMVESREQGEKVLTRLMKRYSQLLIEERIIGREFTVSILGTEALPVIEIRPSRAFYDFKAKYTRGLTEYLIPAPIPKFLSEQLQKIALNAHERLELRDFSRVDMMVDRAGNPFVLEVNSIPGFTETSLLPKAAKEAGMDFAHLCIRLLELARARYQRTKHRSSLCEICN